MTSTLNSASTHGTHHTPAPKISQLHSLPFKRTITGSYNHLTHIVTLILTVDEELTTTLITVLYTSYLALQLMHITLLPPATVLIIPHHLYCLHPPTSLLLSHKTRHSSLLVMAAVITVPNALSPPLSLPPYLTILLCLMLSRNPLSHYMLVHNTSLPKLAHIPQPSTLLKLMPYSILSYSDHHIIPAYSSLTISLSSPSVNASSPLSPALLRVTSFATSIPPLALLQLYLYINSFHPLPMNPCLVLHFTPTPYNNKTSLLSHFFSTATLLLD